MRNNLPSLFPGVPLPERSEITSHPFQVKRQGQADFSSRGQKIDSYLSDPLLRFGYLIAIT
jgi:hypothetical protein